MFRQNSSFARSETSHQFANANESVRWWEENHHQNMIEVESAQELVDSLLNGGERLVVLDFYSPACGGCRTLHPK
ncbi:thioredoxin-like 1-2, chloroplastic [Salvia divinorum]|uniref:Thioredoxin-like 1-2, chloroplastic n=1 Tax=Salvia divinorum TaxID=28513 RepID=A0ABD1IET3_SALDI